MTDPRLPEVQTPVAPAVPPKPNVKFMLKWCRKHIPGFADMHDRAKASRAGVGK